MQHAGDIPLVHIKTKLLVFSESPISRKRLCATRFWFLGTAAVHEFDTTTHLGIVLSVSRSSLDLLLSASLLLDLHFMRYKVLGPVLDVFT